MAKILFSCLLLALTYQISSAYKLKNTLVDELADDVENILENPTEYEDTNEREETVLVGKKKDPLFIRRWVSTATNAVINILPKKPSCNGPGTAQCNVGLTYNGCGSAMFESVKVNVFHKQDLETACNKHDICYGCGNHYGWSQLSCDKIFLQDMLKVCQCRFGGTIYNPTKLTCDGVAHLMYNTVRVLGHNFYRPNSHSYCPNSCVRDNFGPGNVIVLSKK